MSCSSIDLKAYILGESARAEKNAVEDHVRACEGCREELERLKLMETTLRSLTEEEVPQRIAFVSDKVFEPRWYQTIWRSGPAMGFASAALLAGAILVHGFAVNGRPVAQPATQAALSSAQIEQRIEREVNARLDSAVAKAVSVSEARQNEQMATMVAAAEKRFETRRKEDMAVAQQAAQYYDKQFSRLLMAANDQQDQRSGQ